MKNLVRKTLFIALFALGGCGTSPYVAQHSAFILFKTPTLSYADMGFVYENQEEVKVEVYGSGTPVMNLRLKKERVCLNRFACLSYEAFNRRFLSEAYPPTLLAHIFRAEEIFAGEGKKESRNGFTQALKKGKQYNISYEVFKQSVVFRDTINHIVIKIQKTKG
jgi:hypothetical protein